MSLNLLRTPVVRPYSILRTSYILRASYHPQTEAHSTRSEKFFIPASHPDAFDTEPWTKKDSPHAWEEGQATTSEASVKADRGEIQSSKLVSRERQEEILRRESMDPKMDEM